MALRNLISDKYHSYCPDCHRVTYSLSTHGPVTPAQYNRTFCVCNGKRTGIVKQKVVIYGLEDVLGDDGATKVRERMKEEKEKLDKS